MNKAWLEAVRMSACSSIETLEATYDLCRSVIERGVPGDFVECGVYAGAHPAVMAKAFMDTRIDIHNPRRVHLFDTFTGIPAAGPHDEEAREWPANHSACSLDDVKKNLRRWDLPDWLFVFHEGDFNRTILPFTHGYSMTQGIIPLERKPEIAVLRLDGDLYQSTRDCLYLLDYVSQGGWVCLDDFNLSGCRKAVLERVVPAPLYFRVPTK